MNKFFVKYNKKAEDIDVIISQTMTPIKDGYQQLFVDCCGQGYTQCTGTTEVASEEYPHNLHEECAIFSAGFKYSGFELYRNDFNGPTSVQAIADEFNVFFEGFAHFTVFDEFFIRATLLVPCENAADYTFVGDTAGC